jgi:hypothetical protein
VWETFIGAGVEDYSLYLREVSSCSWMRLKQKAGSEEGLLKNLVCANVGEQ